MKEWRMEKKKRIMDGVRWRKMSGSSGCVYQTGVGPCLTERDVGAVSGDSSHVSGEQEESGWTSFWMGLNDSNELPLPFIWKHLQTWGNQARSAAYLISCSSVRGKWEWMLIIDERCSKGKKTTEIKDCCAVQYKSWCFSTSVSTLSLRCVFIIIFTTLPA